MVRNRAITSSLALMGTGWRIASGSPRGQCCAATARTVTTWQRNWGEHRWSERPRRTCGERGMATSLAKAKMLMWEQANTEERRMTLLDMLKFGENADRHTVMLSAVFLQKELPVRLAKRLHELRSLPRPMWSTKAVSSLVELYEESFVRIIDHEPPQNTPSETSFSAMLADIKDKHARVQANIGAGFAEMQRAGVKQCSMETKEIQSVLTKFYCGRIGIRMLIRQHLSLRRDAEELFDGERQGMTRVTQDFVGCVQTRCRIKNVLDAAIADARAACQLHLHCAPEVVIRGNENLTTAYIPEHLYVVLFEVLKNALRATVEHNRAGGRRTQGKDEELPAVECTLSGGEDCFVKISDRGGGIPPSALKRVWNFAFTSAPGGMSELAGYGYGLPLSRLYARYWGGELTVCSLENYGVDCVLRLGTPARRATRDGEVEVWVKRGALHPLQRATAPGVRSMSTSTSARRKTDWANEREWEQEQ